MDDVKKFANTAGENPRRCAKMGLKLWLKKKWLVAQATPAIEVVLVAARGSSQLSPLPPLTPTHSQPLSLSTSNYAVGLPSGFIYPHFTTHHLLRASIEQPLFRQTSSKKIARILHSHSSRCIEIGFTWPTLTGPVERRICLLKE